MVAAHRDDLDAAAEPSACRPPSSRAPARSPRARRSTRTSSPGTSWSWRPMKRSIAGWLTVVVFFFFGDSLLSKSNLDSGPDRHPAVRLDPRRDPVVRVRRDRRRRPPGGDARRAVRHADPDLQHRRHRGDADQHRDARRRRADGRPGHDVRGDDDRAQRRGRALARRRRPQAPHAGLQPARGERVPVRDHPAGHDRADPAERHALDRRRRRSPRRRRSCSPARRSSST